MPTSGDPDVVGNVVTPQSPYLLELVCTRARLIGGQCRCAQDVQCTYSSCPVSSNQTSFQIFCFVTIVAFCRHASSSAAKGLFKPAPARGCIVFKTFFIHCCGLPAFVWDIWANNGIYNQNIFRLIKNYAGNVCGGHADVC